MKQLIYRLTGPLLRYVRSHPRLIRRIFGVRLPSGADVQFDPTTILLSVAVAEEAQAMRLTRPLRSLEMGIGAGALVSLSLAKKGMTPPPVITGCDCVERRVASATEVASFNQLAATFFLSDLFSEVPCPTGTDSDSNAAYDLIFFNPPYVPTAVGEQLDMGKRLTAERTMWDGGDDGLQVLRQFLAEAPQYLATQGRVVFGVQHVFVPDEAVRQVIDDSPFQLVRTVRRRRLPSEVYVLALAMP